MAKFAITIKSSTIVKPSAQTWTGRMSLSELDMTGAISHVDTLYFYAKPTVPQNDAVLVDRLRHALSQTLVPFYPLAGRLDPIGGGRLELDCNAMGVEFIVAEAETASLEGLGVGDLARSSGTKFQPLVPEVNYALPMKEWPLLLVQLTKFGCGGMCLCFNMSHIPADGLSGLHFLNEWARVARGEGIGTMPFHDRKVLRAGEPPLGRQPSFDPAEFQRPPVMLPNVGCTDDNGNGAGGPSDEITVARLKLSKTKLLLLKEMANKGNPNRPYSTYETLTAHTWRCACKARKLKPNQPTAVGVYVDVRRRLNPPLPDAYLGDAVFGVKAISLSGDLVNKPLGYAAETIREAVEKVDGEFLSSAVEYLKHQPDLTKFQDSHEVDGVRDDGEHHEEPFYGMPNLVVSSWLRLPLLGLDFGFGKEVYMDTTFDFDGDATLSHSQDGDGSVVLAICFRSDHVDEFERLFYDDIIV
ncbi:unnamed protein product [Linum tenue]|uniref:Uncharacterized protein n=1 Tax=Linum tenue TaxID=586396 RepID=A0AAV0N2A0_9ROSI|nr:unnamed protein product [Linum tenue]